MPAPPSALETPAFRLSKWYLDLVTDDGEAVIGYRASAAYRGLSGAYASVLHRPAAGPVRTASTLRAGDGPEACGALTGWSCPALGVCAGRWAATAPAIERELWRSPAGGSVAWACFAPAAEATLTVDGRSLRGVGYVERLDLTVAPWSLPIRELRWGRWTARDDAGTPRSVVWIDWAGEHPLTLVALDGREVGGRVGDDAVTLDGGRTLPLPRDATLREGPIGTTALSFIPGLKHLLPPALLATHEHKWLGRTSLHAPGAGAAEGPSGWAIHELVRFGGEDR